MAPKAKQSDADPEPKRRRLTGKITPTDAAADPGADSPRLELAEKPGSSKYKGVSKLTSGKFQAGLGSKYIGSFATELEAAEARWRYKQETGDAAPPKAKTFAAAREKVNEVSKGKVDEAPVVKPDDTKTDALLNIGSLRHTPGAKPASLSTEQKERIERNRQEALKKQKEKADAMVSATLPASKPAAPETAAAPTAKILGPVEQRQVPPATKGGDNASSFLAGLERLNALAFAGLGARKLLTCGGD